jgi:hypothetical protein
MNTIPTANELWLSNATGARHPDDSMFVHGVTVSVSPQGGGFIRKIPLADFLANFSRVENPDKQSDYRLAFFYFDEGPAILGWTSGNRWNGWGCPLLERSCIERYIEQLPWEQICFKGDELVYHDENYDAEEQAEAIKPQVIRHDGKDFQVYAFGGLGFCWNQRELEDATGHQDCLNAITPPEITNPVSA